MTTSTFGQEIQQSSPLWVLSYLVSRWLPVMRNFW